jgi:hypothetical protein
MTYHRLHSRASVVVNAVLAFFCLAATGVYAQWRSWGASVFAAALGIAFVTACYLSILDIRRDFADSTRPRSVSMPRLALEFLAIPLTAAYFIGEVSAGEVFWATVSGVLLVTSAVVFGTGIAANEDLRRMDGAAR